LRATRAPSGSSEQETGMTVATDVTKPTQALIDEVLEVYPEKFRKRRAKHVSVQTAEAKDCGVKSNIKSIPGVMTIRGCAYAGSKADPYPHFTWRVESHRVELVRQVLENASPKQDLKRRERDFLGMCVPTRSALGGLEVMIQSMQGVSSQGR
jgi:hypothetical protein